MDRSREFDLAEMEKRKNESGSTKERERYEKQMYKIKEQADNKDLAKARERLINAHKNRDVEVADKITEEIKRIYG
jgi:hypothetical protein